jgi:hypothetical protein
VYSWGFVDSEGGLDHERAKGGESAKIRMGARGVRRPVWRDGQPSWRQVGGCTVFGLGEAATDFSLSLSILLSCDRIRASVSRPVWQTKEGEDLVSERQPTSSLGPRSR